MRSRAGQDFLAACCLVGLTLALPSPSREQTASLLPNGQQQFTDANGAPLSGGSVQFCIPNTNCATQGQTWSDPYQTNLNPNPVPLDAGGRATIFGLGSYEQVVRDATGTAIWDKLTFGTSPQTSSLLASLPGNSLVGKSNVGQGSAQAVGVFGGVGFSAGALTTRQPVVQDTTSPQGVNSQFSGSLHIANAGSITYNLPSASSVFNGFSFSIYASQPTQAQASGSDQIVTAGGTSVSLPAGAIARFTTDGAQSWYVSTTQSSQNGLLPAGAVVEFRGTTCPPGTLPEDGSTVSRTKYATLFAAIGTTWGSGNGSTNFNLPDAGGRFNRGWESGQTIDAGRTFGAPQNDQLQDHTHTTSAVAKVSSSAGGQPNTLQDNSPTTVATSGVVTSSGASGVRAGSETRPVNITALSCIVTGN